MQYVANILEAPTNLRNFFHRFNQIFYAEMSIQTEQVVCLSDEIKKVGKSIWSKCGKEK